MKTLNKVISGLLIGGVIVSTSAVAMAANTKTAPGKNNDFQGRSPIAGKMMRGKDMDKGSLGKDIMKNNIENDLKALVSANVITQDESDKILALSKQESEARQAEMDKVKNMTDDERKAYFDSMKGQTPEKKGDIFAQAVKSGIITQEKADTAKTKLQESRDTEKKAKLTEGLSGLVTSGTITQEQADKVLAYANTLEANKPAPGTAPAAAPKEEKKNPLSSLVDDGTLTQAQLDAVCKVLPMGGGRGHGGPGGLGMNRPAKAAADTASSDTTK